MILLFVLYNYDSNIFSKLEKFVKSEFSGNPQPSQTISPPAQPLPVPVIVEWKDAEAEGLRVIGTASYPNSRDGDTAVILSCQPEMRSETRWIGETDALLKHVPAPTVTVVISMNVGRTGLERTDLSRCGLGHGRRVEERLDGRSAGARQVSRCDDDPVFAIDRPLATFSASKTWALIFSAAGTPYAHLIGLGHSRVASILSTCDAAAAVEAGRAERERTEAIKALRAIQGPGVYQRLRAIGALGGHTAEEAFLIGASYDTQGPDRDIRHAWHWIIEGLRLKPDAESAASMALCHLQENEPADQLAGLPQVEINWCAPVLQSLCEAQRGLSSEVLANPDRPGAGIDWCTRTRLTPTATDAVKPP